MNDILEPVNWILASALFLRLGLGLLIIVCSAFAYRGLAGARREVAVAIALLFVAGVAVSVLGAMDWSF